MRRLLRRRALAIVVVALVVVAGVGAWLLTRDSGSGNAVPASTVQVTSQTEKQTVAATGTIDAADTADLDFDVSGTVTQVLVTLGQQVSVGQPLAKVDATALVAARTAAQSSLTAANEQLHTDEDNDASDVQLAADRTAIVSARSTLDSADRAVSDATLKATIAGQVTAVNLEVGDTVGSTGASGDNRNASNASNASNSSSDSGSSSAFTITSTGSYVVDATVSAADVGQIKPGMQAQITATGVSDTIYGVVSTVGLVAQTSSTGAAEFPVTIKVTGTPKDVYAGTSATVSIIVKQTPNVLTVPSRALRTSGTSTYVMKMVGGKAVKTTVTTGTTYGADTQVLSGLKAGDTVQVPGFSLPSGVTRNGGSGRTGFGGAGLPGGGFPGGGGFGGNGPQVFTGGGGGK